MRRAHVVLLLGVFALVAAWRLSAFRGPAGVEAPDVCAQASPSAARGPATEFDGPGSESDSGERSNARAVPDDIDPRPAFGAEIVACCRDQGGGGALPRAELFVRDLAMHDLDSNGDEIADIVRRGTRREADDLGRVRFARPTAPVVLLARSGELAALVSIDPATASPIELRLAPHPELEILVRDPSGKPAPGIGLRLFDDAYASLVSWRGRTDGAGRAVVDELFVPDAGAVVFVMVELPTHERLLRAIRGDFARTPRIEFVVPRFRPQELAIVDRERRRLPCWESLGVRVAPAGEAPIEFAYAPDGYEVDVRDGRATLNVPVEAAEVVLVLPGDVECRVPRPQNGWGGGPIELALPSDMLVVRRTLVDVDGEPLRSRSVATEIAERGPRWCDSGRGQRRTDAEGRIAILAHPDWTDTGRRILLVDREVRPMTFGAVRIRGTRVENERDAAADPALDAAAKLTTPGDPGSVDGWPTLRLALAPVALSGRVTDELGGPIAFAKLDVRPFWAEGYLSPVPTCGEVLTDVRGRFTAYGEPTESDLGVEVVRDGDKLVAVDGTRFPLGARDVAVRVRAFGSTYVELLVDPSVDLEALGAKDASAGGWCDDHAWREGDRACLRLDGLESGRHDLAFSTADGEHELARIDGVEIVAGRTTRDPRLVPLDLRGKIPPAPRGSIVELRLVDADGGAIESGLVSWGETFTPEGDENVHVLRYSASGWAGGSIRVRREFDRLVVWSPGFDLLEGPAPTSDAAWTLVRAREHVFRVAVPRELRAPSLSYGLAFDVAPDDRLSEFTHGGTSRTPDARGEVRIGLAASATYHVRACATWRECDDGGMREVPLQEYEVEIRADGTTEHELPIDLAAWKQVLLDEAAPIEFR